MRIAKALLVACLALGLTEIVYASTLSELHEAWQADYMTLDSVTTLHGTLKRDKRVVVTTGNPNLLNTKS